MLAPALLVGVLAGGAAPAMASEEPTLTVAVYGGHGQVKVQAGATEASCTYVEGQCAYKLPEGTEVKLLAEPAGETEFVGWLSQACEEHPLAVECEFKIQQSTPVLARFKSILNPPVINSPTQGAVIESASGEVTVEFGADPRAAEVMCIMDSDTTTHCTSPKTYSSLAAGEHEVEVREIDGEGEFLPAAVRFTIVSPPAPEEEPKTFVPPEAIFGTGGGGSKVGPRASLAARWQVRGELTVVRKLVLERLAAGARVRVRCTGGGCPFGKRALRARGATLSLTRLFGGHALRAGAVVQLTIDPPGSNPQVLELKFRAGKRPTIVRR